MRLSTHLPLSRTSWAPTSNTPPNLLALGGGGAPALADAPLRQLGTFLLCRHPGILLATAGCDPLRSSAGQRSTTPDSVFRPHARPRHSKIALIGSIPRGRGQKRANMSTVTFLVTANIDPNGSSRASTRSRAQTWCKSVLRSVAANPDVTPSLGRASRLSRPRSPWRAARARGAFPPSAPACPRARRSPRRPRPRRTRAAGSTAPRSP